jgi:hypothetical protein
MPLNDILKATILSETIINLIVIKNNLLFFLDLFSKLKRKSYLCTP